MLNGKDKTNNGTKPESQEAVKLSCGLYVPFIFLHHTKSIYRVNLICCVLLLLSDNLNVDLQELQMRSLCSAYFL